MPNKSLVIFRPFEGMEVKQEVDSLLYNANDVLRAYNESTGDTKRLDKYLDFSGTREYVAFLRWESKSPSEGELNYSPEKPKVEGIISTKKGKFGWTWMNQHLLVDFMMWLSPAFKHKAITFILEWQVLAVGRNKIKEGYKRMCKAIAESGSSNYRDEATMLNVLTSWSPSSGQRARYGEDKIELMDDMQKSNATMIRLGMSLDERKNALIKEFLS